LSDITVIGAAEAEAQIGRIASVRDYFELLKPRVMSLVVFTALVGLLIAPGDLHPVLGFTAILCIAIGAGASGALNMWFDADIDAKMSRTRNRPIPTGRIARGEALGFGATLAVAAVSVMELAVGVVPAVLLAGTILYYVLFYTVWLKRRTPQNIVIGGAAGAFPPIIGWAAVTGGISLEPVLLFAIIFMWTPPHFWALSLFRREDYVRAGIPMLPVVAGERETRRHILLYSLILAPLVVAPYALGMTGPLYGIVAGVLGLVLVALAFQVWRARDREDGSYREARRLFGFSILFLFLIFLALLGDHVVASVL
jgi:protoheme IX farnesyltransferase